MRNLLICFFFALAAPAFADTTAIYQTPTKTFVMTVEIASNGDLRSDVAGKPGTYALTRNGEGYMVISTAQGVVVDRVEDLGAALKIVAEKRLSPSLLAMMKTVGPNLAKMHLRLVKGDDVTIQGRKGTPYYFRGPPPPGFPPAIIICSDPELAPIGVAMARQIAMSDSFQMFEPGNPFSLAVKATLKTGAPLEFAGAELTMVSHDPISLSRFELPAAPESREAIIKRIDAAATSQRVTAF